MKMIEIPVLVSRKTAFKSLFGYNKVMARIPFLDLIHTIAGQLPESAGTEDDAWMGSASDELNTLLKRRGIVE